MTVRNIDNSQRTAAKVAGISGLLTVAIVVFANYVLLNPLIVPGNAVETARNIVAHETQFRITAVCFLIYSAAVRFLLTALHLLLRPVKQGLPFVRALFRLVFALLWLLPTPNMFGALRHLGSPSWLQVLQADRLQTLARLHLAANFDDYYAGLPFFGLAATVCSYLWLRSNYIPKSLSIFGLISSAWCVVCALVFLIFPHFNKTVNDYWFDSPMALFELALSLWLLFKGLKLSESGEPVSARS